MNLLNKQNNQYKYLPLDSSAVFAILLGGLCGVWFLADWVLIHDSVITAIKKVRGHDDIDTEVPVCEEQALISSSLLCVWDHGIICENTVHGQYV